MRPAETTEAILLRRIRFGESGNVLVWLAPEHGKVRTAAREGSRKSGKMHALPDLFYQADQFPRQGNRPAALREVRLIETRTDCVGITAGCWLRRILRSSAIFVRTDMPPQGCSIFCAGRWDTSAAMRRPAVPWCFSRRRRAGSWASDMRTMLSGRSRSMQAGFPQTAAAWRGCWPESGPILNCRGSAG